MPRLLFANPVRPYTDPDLSAMGTRPPEQRAGEHAARVHPPSPSGETADKRTARALIQESRSGSSALRVRRTEEARCPDQTYSSLTRAPTATSCVVYMLG